MPAPDPMTRRAVLAALAIPAALPLLAAPDAAAAIGASAFVDPTGDRENWTTVTVQGPLDVDPEELNLGPDDLIVRVLRGYQGACSWAEHLAQRYPNAPGAAPRRGWAPPLLPLPNHAKHISLRLVSAAIDRDLPRPLSGAMERADDVAESLAERARELGAVAVGIEMWPCLRRSEPGSNAVHIELRAAFLVESGDADGGFRWVSAKDPRRKVTGA